MKATDSSEIIFCCSFLIGLKNLFAKTPDFDAVKEESDARSIFFMFRVFYKLELRS